MAKYVDTSTTNVSDITVKVMDADLSTKISETKEAFDTYVKEQEKKAKEYEKVQAERDKEQKKFQDNFNQMLPQLHTAFTNINSAVQSLNDRLKMVEDNQIKHEEIISQTAETLKEVSSEDTSSGEFPKEQQSEGNPTPTTESTQESKEKEQLPTQTPKAQQTKTDASRTPEDVGVTKTSQKAADAQGDTTTDRGTDTNVGTGTQAEEAAKLQDAKDAFRNAAIVKVLEQIRDFFSSFMNQFEKFNDELRRTYHVNGETSTKIMDATMGARSSVKSVLDIHVTVSESIDAIKNQVLKNGVNATQLNDSTLALVTGLDKFGVNVQKDTLMALDNMKMSTEAQKMINESLMAARSGENTIRTDTTKLSQDLEQIVGLAQASMKSGDETAQMMAQYTQEVQKMVNNGVEQSKAQQMALADMRSSVGLYGGQGQLQLWREMAGFLNSAGINTRDMKSSEMQEQFMELMSSNKEMQDRLATYARQLQQRGGAEDFKTAMNLLNMANNREVHIATADEARKGEEHPLWETLKDNIGGAVGGALTGVTSFMWGAAGQGTLSDIVKRGFNLVIAAISAQSLLKAFPQAKDFLEATAKGTGAMSKVASGILSIATDGWKSVLGSIAKVALPLAGILAAVAAISITVKSISKWRDNAKDKKEAEEKARKAAAELERARSAMRSEYQKSGDSQEYRKLSRRVAELEGNYDASLGKVLETTKDYNESLGGVIGVGSGLTAGALGGVWAGAKLGSKFGAIGGGYGKVVGAVIGAALGAAGLGYAGEGIGRAISDEDTKENREALRAKYASSEGNIFSQEAVTTIAEGNKPEAVLPATKPDRMKELSTQMSMRTDIPESSQKAFSAMSDSLSTTDEDNEKAKSTIKQLLAWAASQEGKAYELHGQKDPYTGIPWEGYVCNQLVANAFKAIGRKDLYGRFSNTVRSIVYGFNSKRRGHMPGVVDDPDWVTVPQDQIKAGMIVFTGTKDFPGHVGIASGPDTYWNASGSASIYDDPAGFLRTRTSNRGVRNSAWPKKNFKLAGYFKSLLGNYTSSYTDLGEPDMSGEMGDDETAPPRPAIAAVPEDKKLPTVTTQSASGDLDSSERKRGSVWDILRGLDNVYDEMKDVSIGQRVAKQLALAVLGSKSNFSSLFMPDELDRMQRNIFAKSQDDETRTMQYATLREGFENYIRQLDERYTVLGGMDAFSQLRYLRTMGEFTEDQASLISMQESMRNLAKEMHELASEVKKQNRDRDVDRLRSSTMPMQSRISAF